MSTDAERGWQHPWLRVSLLIRSILGTRWDNRMWPVIKPELRKAIEMKSRLERAPWWN